MQSASTAQANFRKTRASKSHSLHKRAELHSLAQPQWSAAVVAGPVNLASYLPSRHSSITPTELFAKPIKLMVSRCRSAAALPPEVFLRTGATLRSWVRPFDETLRRALIYRLQRYPPWPLSIPFIGRRPRAMVQLLRQYTAPRFVITISTLGGILLTCRKEALKAHKALGQLAPAYQGKSTSQSRVPPFSQI